MIELAFELAWFLIKLSLFAVWLSFFFVILIALGIGATIEWAVKKGESDYFSSATRDWTRMNDSFLRMF